MEKAILKTLIYADIFDYPLKAYEIHKWLIGSKATLRQTEKALERLSKKEKVKRKKGYYFLTGKEKLVGKRLIKEKQSKKHLLRAKIITTFLKVIPFIKLIGISGGLAMENADKKDDIDLFIVTKKNRLWLTRLLTIGILGLMGVRRKAEMSSSKAAGKLCPNILIEEDKLEQENKDIYTAHEVLQMKILWQRNGIYSKYLEDNQWSFKFLPNWTGNQYQVLSSKYHVSKSKIHNTKYIILNTILNIFEGLSKKFQLMIMKSPKGMERIQDGALYFHPNDTRPKVASEYKKRIKLL